MGDCEPPLTPLSRRPGSKINNRDSRAKGPALIPPSAPHILLPLPLTSPNARSFAYDRVAA